MTDIASVCPCANGRQVLPTGLSAICAAVAVAMAGVPVIASAQTSAAAKEGGALEEIIVTAERRSEDVQRTAVAVSVRDGEELQTEGKFTLNQILEDVPGVSLAVPFGTSTVSDVLVPNVIIRGASSNGAAPGSPTSLVPAIASYVDGVVNGVGGGYDISRVEVLRGPQGTLYGRSATGGVVNILTNKPTLGEFGGNAAVEAGNYSLQHVTGALNLPAGDMFAVRVSGNYYSRDGYYSEDGGKQNVKEGRGKLLFKPNESLSALLGFAIRDNDLNSGGPTTAIAADKSLTYLAAPLGTAKEIHRQYWAQVDWDFGPAVLTYMPAWHTYEMHGVISDRGDITAVNTTTESIPNDRFHTEELRLASSADSRIKWQTGLFYYDNDVSDLKYKLVITNPNTGVSTVFHDANASRLTRNLGAFAEATWPITDATRVTTGLRYDRTKVSAAITNCPNVCYSLTPEEGTRTWNNYTYKLRLEHDLAPSNLIYFSVASAFLPGDVAVVRAPPSGQPGPSSYEPETLTSFELGSKNRFLADSLQLNADVFYYRYGGMQQTLNQGFVPIGNGLRSATYVAATSPARMEGAEVELIWQPTRADRFELNASYVNAYYVDKSDAFQRGVAQDKIPGVIPWTIYPSYSHTFSLPADQSLKIGLEVLYHSDYSVNAVTPAQAAGGYEQYMRPGSQITGNVNVAWSFASRYSLSAYVRNVTDEQYVNYVNLGNTNPLTAPFRANYSDPRTYGVVLNASF